MSVGLKFSSDFGGNLTQVTPDRLKGTIMAVAVNCNGTAIYVSEFGRGVLVALAESDVSIPLDETSGVQYGQFTGGDSDSGKFTSSSGRSVSQQNSEGTPDPGKQKK